MKTFENVNIDYEAEKIYGAVNELRDCSTAALSSQSNSTVASCSSLEVTEIWTDRTVKLLIDVYKENKNKFESPAYTKKKFGK